jgi:hypothetical protein
MRVRRAPVLGALRATCALRVAEVALRAETTYEVLARFMIGSYRGRLTAIARRARVSTHE